MDEIDPPPQKLREQKSSKDDTPPEPNELLILPAQKILNDVHLNIYSCYWSA